MFNNILKSISFSKFSNSNVSFLKKGHISKMSQQQQQQHFHKPHNNNQSSFSTITKQTHSSSKSNSSQSFKKENSDQELLKALLDGKLASHSLESIVDAKRAVKLRRDFLERQSPKIANGIFDLPLNDFDYEKIKGVNCENVIGFIQIPVGVVGGLIVDKENYFVPMATTEGALIASTSRGCKGNNNKHF